MILLLQHYVRLYRDDLAFAKRAIAHEALVVATVLRRSSLNTFHANPFIDQVRRDLALRDNPSAGEGGSKPFGNEHEKR